MMRGWRQAWTNYGGKPPNPSASVVNSTTPPTSLTPLLVVPFILDSAKNFTPVYIEEYHFFCSHFFSPLHYQERKIGQQQWSAEMAHVIACDGMMPKPRILVSASHHMRSCIHLVRVSFHHRLRNTMHLLSNFLLHEIKQLIISCGATPSSLHRSYSNHVALFVLVGRITLVILIILNLPVFPLFPLP